MTKLLVATNNQGKLREYRELLSSLGVELISLSDAGINLEVKETGATFAENAILKAQTYARISGLCTLADDSGLQVDALGGEPGVMSSRYVGPNATDADRVRYLLEKLENVPPDERSATFRAAIAVATPAGKVQVVEGCCKGLIATEPRGVHGFGYDPVFIIPELGKTMAELSPSEKNRISHRAQAAAKARHLINELIRLGECE